MNKSGATLKGRRLLVSFDEDGREQVQFVDDDACILKWADLPRLIRSPDCYLTPDFLRELIAASADRLVAKLADAIESNRLLRQALQRNNRPIAFN